MSAEEDAMAQLGQALGTPVGSKEIALTLQLGMTGYTEWKERDDRLQEAQIQSVESDATFKVLNAGFIMKQGKYIEGKGSFWSALAFAITIGTIAGAADLVKWMVGG